MSEVDPLRTFEQFKNQHAFGAAIVQRRLKLGYFQATKLIEQWEKLGFIQAIDINKPYRFVFKTKETLNEQINRIDAIEDQVINDQLISSGELEETKGGDCE